MRIVVKMTIECDDGSVASEGEIFRMTRDGFATGPQAGFGLSLYESKKALSAIQTGIMAAQTEQIVARASRCPDCGAMLKVKDKRHVVY